MTAHLVVVDDPLVVDKVAHRFRQVEPLDLVAQGVPQFLVSGARVCVQAVFEGQIEPQEVGLDRWFGGAAFAEARFRACISCLVALVISGERIDQ